MTEAAKPDLTTLTVDLLSAYVSNNNVASNELADLIRSTRAALSDEAVPEAPEKPEFVPAVSVRKSRASRDHLISMIDGKPYKSLKRHLSSHGLTPAEYRERYNLSDDYPMVAPGYSEQRRAVAERLGLGRKRRVASEAASETPVVEAPPAAVPEPAAVAAKPKRQRKAQPLTASAPEAPVESSASDAAEPVSQAAPAEAKQTAETKPAAKAKPAAEAKPRRQRKARPAAADVAEIPAVSAAPEDNAEQAPSKVRKPRTGKLATIKAKLATQSGDTNKKGAAPRRGKAASSKKKPDAAAEEAGQAPAAE